MPRYSTAFRAKMIEKMLGPSPRSATALSGETGISQATLSRWLREARSMGVMSKDKKKRKSRRRWTPAERLRVVLAAEGLSADDLGALLRREGLHSRDLERWREQALVGLQSDTGKGKETEEQRRIRELHRELRRKDKALAETAALLALKKKAQAIWGDEDDDTENGS